MGSRQAPKVAWDQNREGRTQSEQCCQLAAAAIDPEDKAFWSCLVKHWLWLSPPGTPAPLAEP